MKRIRVIPVLSIAGNKLVKTVNFKQPNYLGDPLNAIKIFNEKRVDELMVLDITASREQKEPNYRLIEEMAGEAFMPLGYGGGINTFEQAARIFSLGIEKVILNSVLRRKPGIISQIAAVYGNQSVVVSLDLKKSLFGSYKPVFCSASEGSRESPEDLIRTYTEMGAGEIIIHNVDREGTYSGYDTELIKRFSGAGVPIVALGGCNSYDNMKHAVQSGANAIAASSIFSYRNGNKKSILINYKNYFEFPIIET